MRAMLMATLTFAGCTYETIPEGGDGTTVECVGLASDQNPRYVYQANGWNIAMGIIFSGLIVPPVVVLASAWSCPKRVRTPREAM